jgi:hypothetical protein
MIDAALRAEASWAKTDPAHSAAVTANKITLFIVNSFLVVGFTKNITYFDGIKRTLFMCFVWELDIMSCFVRYLYKNGGNVKGSGLSLRAKGRQSCYGRPWT